MGDFTSDAGVFRQAKAERAGHRHVNDALSMTRLTSPRDASSFIPTLGISTAEMPGRGS